MSPTPTVLSQGRFGAAYAIPEGIPISERLAAFFAGRLNASDPLLQLVEPVDQRGEVNAWGGPHFTLLDALTVRDLKIFQSVVREVCSTFSPPTITAREIVIWSGKSLVLRCESPELERVRAALIAATRSCIERSEISDEEVQKARWWIDQHSSRPRIDLPQLDDALCLYADAGRPPLPTSRHFRLGFLVRLVKELRRAPETERIGREQSLSHFFTFGEPPWYAGSGALHLTLASGLAVGTDVNALKKSIEPSVLADFPPTSLRRIAVMTEDPKSTVQTNFFDWLTETPIHEQRLSLTEYSSATFDSFIPETKIKKITKWEKAKQYAAQTEIVRQALATPDHSLNVFLSLMRSTKHAAVYLSGSRLDSDCCFGSLDVGLLISVLPEDGDKAAAPGYHPGSTEIYVAFQGSLVMECLENDRVTSKIVGHNEVLVLPAGRCHRVRYDATCKAASAIIKTNLSYEPGVLRCDTCEYYKNNIAACPLHQRWIAESRPAAE